MTQYGFFFDGTRCTGCKTCQLACIDNHSLTAATSLRRVFECTGGETSRDEGGCVSTSCWSYTMSVSCNHCDNPACVAACPTGAMQKDPQTGLVSNDREVCVGCGACAQACPYSAPRVDAEAGKAVKCDGCAERLAAGLAPVCVLACPARALAFGPVEEMAQMGQMCDVAPFCPASQTMPNLYVRPSADARPAGEAAACNPLEV